MTRLVLLPLIAAGLVAGAAWAQPAGEPSRYRIDAEIPLSETTLMLNTSTVVGGRTEVRDAGPVAHAMTVQLNEIGGDDDRRIQAAVELSRREDGRTVVLSSPRMVFRPAGRRA